MPIPSSKLETWTKQGAVQSAKRTHQPIRQTLSDPDSVLTQKDVEFEDFLQGSYKNTTNIYADSDVDLVVECRDLIVYDTRNLTEGQRKRVEKRYSDSSYSWAAFREDVLETLVKQYGRGALTEGNKALKLESDQLPLDADILVCIRYRRYDDFESPPGTYTDGIAFWTLRDNRRIVNFPRQHYENGTAKHDRTDGRYKPTVRMVKNARSYLVEKGLLGGDVAPSYFVECMLYNVPARRFVSDLQKRYAGIVDFLTASNLEECVCQNGEQALFGSRDTQWTVGDAGRFLQALVRLWNDWYEI